MSDVEKPAINPWFIAPVVALAAFMEILDLSIANVALPHIAGNLSASQDESTWVLTSYLVTNAVVMPISGWLSNRFGRKRFFLTCIACFTIASFFCGIAPNLASLIILRGIQGAAGGGLQPSGQAILADSFPPEKRGMATAIYGISAVFAPAIGPTLGGFITDNYSWRWIFLINVPVGLILTILVTALIHEAKPSPSQNGGKSSIDWAGFALVGLTLSCLQIVLDRGQLEDWFASDFITILVVLSAVGFIALLVWELRHPHPVINLRLLANADFAVSFCLMLMLGFMLLGSTFLIPAFAQGLLGYTAMDAGMVLTPGGFVIIALLPLVGKVINKVDVRILLAIGLTMTSFGLFWMTSYYLQVSYNMLMWGRILQASGMAFLFIPINTVAFRSVSRDKINDASALVNLARNFGGSVGISFASTMLTRRAQFHQSRLVDSLNPLNPAYADYVHHAQHLIGNSLTVPALIYQQLVQQATMLSYLDDFKINATIAICLVPLLLFVKKGKGGAGGVAH